MPLNIAIIGVGGVGGYFGGKLCRLVATQSAKVFFVARTKHLEVIRAQGLTVRTEKEGDWICKPSFATDRLNDLPQLDVCFICVKVFDLHNILVQLQSNITANTIIIPLLNGIDICDRIRKVLSVGRIFPACVYIGAHIAEPGVVIQKGGACQIQIGSEHRNVDTCPQLLVDIFQQSGIQYQWHKDVYPEIWRKFIFIAAFGMVTAVFDKTMGEVLESHILSSYVSSIMCEIIDVARYLGMDMKAIHYKEIYAKGKDFPFGAKTSFQRDYECASKPDERDLFGATILRLAQKGGIRTPAVMELTKKLSQKIISGF